ncbi:MAG: hypothetical protein ACK5PB_16675 [Pirellula sp.]|jgi:hypothetical protein
MVKYSCFFLLSGHGASESSFHDLCSSVSGEVNRPKKMIESEVGYGDWRFLTKAINGVDFLPSSQIEDLLKRLASVKHFIKALSIRILQIQVTVVGDVSEFNGVSLDPSTLKLLGDLNAILDIAVSFTE